MKRPIGPPSPNLSNGTKSVFVRKKFQRMVGSTTSRKRKEPMKDREEKDRQQ